MARTAQRITCPTCGGRAYWLWSGGRQNDKRFECRARGCDAPKAVKPQATADALRVLSGEGESRA